MSGTSSCQRLAAFATELDAAESGVRSGPNASIVAEIVTYGGTTLSATGLGAYIAAATEAGDFHQILAGVALMALYMVTINRLFWRRLYALAERRYSLA